MQWLAGSFPACRCLLNPGARFVVLAGWPLAYSKTCAFSKHRSMQHAFCSDYPCMSRYDSDVRRVMA